MATEGPNSPTTSKNDTAVGTESWVDLGNAFASDDAYATVTLNSQTSYYLFFKGYGFTIPTGATIDGVLVSFERSQTGTGEIYDGNVKLVLADVASGSPSSLSAAQWPTSDASQNYGAADDLWSLSLSASDINNANFGFAISATETAGSSATARADTATITVYYTPAPGPAAMQAKQRRINALRRM